MDYQDWRSDLFGQPPGSDPVLLELREETEAVSPEEAFDHIDRALVDTAIHDLYSKEQIATGLQLIYCNSCGDLPYCYISAGDEQRRIRGIRNLVFLYDNYFERYCTAPIRSIGNDSSDGRMGFLCYMLWDIFVLHPGNASGAMVAAGLDVMAHVMTGRNENCLVSAIHGLGHWVDEAPAAGTILEQWLRAPTVDNRKIHKYVQQAMTGCIL